MSSEFIIYSDHEALKHIHSQKKLDRRHAQWSQFKESYHYALRHKLSTENKVAIALGRRNHLLTTLLVEVTGFESLKEDYAIDKDFGSIYCGLVGGMTKEQPSCSLHDGYIFWGTKLCIPDSSYREFLI